MEAELEPLTVTENERSLETDFEVVLEMENDGETDGDAERRVGDKMSEGVSPGAYHMRDFDFEFDCSLDAVLVLGLNVGEEVVERDFWKLSLSDVVIVEVRSGVIEEVIDEDSLTVPVPVTCLLTDFELDGDLRVGEPLVEMLSLNVKVTEREGSCVYDVVMERC